MNALVMTRPVERASPIRFKLAAAGCAVLVLATIFDVAAACAQSAVKTGKERLGDKASDEQRVDNCKVPPERWGKTARSVSCVHGGKPNMTH
jgi:hypothetical protein